MAVNIGLNEVMIKSSKTVLNNLLADHFVLLTKTWNYHWNVKGVSFHSYHVFMEELYNGLILDIDAIAERVRALDERPIASLAGFLEHNRLKEHCESQSLPEAKQMLAILSQDNDTTIREIRKDIEQLEKEGSEDAGTINFLEDMIEKKEKIAWMIRAYLEK
ncbi:MAG: DNA starvation/stationary phase protection protein [Odoribacter sp.]